MSLTFDNSNCKWRLVEIKELDFLEINMPELHTLEKRRIPLLHRVLKFYQTSQVTFNNHCF